MPVISDLQHKILEQFGRAVDSRHFYLTGGTALAHFYLQHRKSEDLDFFTSAVGLISAFGVGLEHHLTQKGFTVKRQRAFETFVELHVSKADEFTLIHVALDTPFRFENTRQFDHYPGLNVDSLTDIAANKLLALFGRAALRDFIDVYYLIKTEKFSKTQMLDQARKKDPGFDLYWLGVAFERLKAYQQKDYDLSLVFDPLKAEELLSFFNQWGKEIASSLSG
ncbi:MAG: nucleotidyl transferase AbiEii/AbiGii toxin family protein [Candidatus Omnitrophica bacterium]|nr:nucleotidyl transferase AbiEii/AbiGii toxin family protein [Candidatus Omnitrophota bacterium]